MVSKARLDLPEPDSPVNTIIASRGRSSETSFRLCSRAPRTTSRSATCPQLLQISQFPRNRLTAGPAAFPGGGLVTPGINDPLSTTKPAYRGFQLRSRPALAAARPASPPDTQSTL